MQKIVSEGTLKYNLISRAIYYGASLLRNTVPAGDTEYTGIHKVYTIWFCAHNLALEMYDEIEGQYIHRYGFRRFYDGIDKTVKPEPFADLIEVVLVELEKLKKQDDETEKMVYTLFNDTLNVVNLIESSEKVKLTKVMKGVTDMIDYEARTQQRETIARQKERLEAARNLVDSLKDEKPEASYKVIIAKAASLLKLDQKTVIELQEAYNTKQTV